MTGLPTFWLRLEGKIDDYMERPKCARCGKKLKRGEKVCFDIAVCPRESGGCELALPGGRNIPISVFCMKCKSMSKEKEGDR